MQSFKSHRHIHTHTYTTPHLSYQPSSYGSDNRDQHTTRNRAGCVSFHCQCLCWIPSLAGFCRALLSLFISNNAHRTLSVTADLQAIRCPHSTISHPCWKIWWQHPASYRICCWEVCRSLTPLQPPERKVDATIKQGVLKGIIQRCLWKEPGVHWRRGVSFEFDEEFTSDLKLWYG